MPVDLGRCVRRTVALVLFMAPFVAWPNYERAIRHPSSRTCFATQRTVAEALEKRTGTDGEASDVLDPQVLDELVRTGFLSALPQDPGGGEGSAANYRLWRGVVFCTRHGFLTPPEGASHATPAREQLRMAGCGDDTLLAAASTDPPFPECVPRHDLGALGAILCWGLAVVLIRPRASSR